LRDVGCRRTDEHKKTSADDDESEVANAHENDANHEEARTADKGEGQGPGEYHLATCQLT